MSVAWMVERWVGRRAASSAMTLAVGRVFVWVAQTDALRAEYSAARSDDLSVASMDERTAVMTDACWVDLKAVQMDALSVDSMVAMWVASRDASTADYSVHCSAVCWVDQMVVMKVAQMDER